MDGKETPRITDGVRALEQWETTFISLAKRRSWGRKVSWAERKELT